MKLLKGVLIWLLCGILGIGVGVKYYTKEPLRMGDAILISLGGPLILVTILGLAVIKNLNTVCAVNCEGNK